MFGDFLSLTFDQILNNLSKPLYGNNTETPLVIRTPKERKRLRSDTFTKYRKHFWNNWIKYIFSKSILSINLVL